MTKMEMLKNININKEQFYIGNLPYDLIKTGYKNLTKSIKYIVLVIPGNPGLVAFYEQFIKYLQLNLNPSYAVWCVSHAIFSEKDCLSGVDSDVLLTQEIEHKLIFLEKKLPPNVKIFLIGHSIGCHMILSVLEILSRKNKLLVTSHALEKEYKQDRHIYVNINKCFLLFPTIERMKCSPNGRRLLPILTYFQTFCSLAAGIISYLPVCVKNVVYSFFLPSSCDDNIKEAIDILISSKYVRNMMQLAENELNTVITLDTNMIRDLSSKIVIYYGKSDSWCPLFYRDELVAKVPQLNTIVDNNNIAHAFVISHASIMAIKLADLIKKSTIPSE